MGPAPRTPEPLVQSVGSRGRSSAKQGAAGGLLRLSLPRELGGGGRAQYVATGPLCSLPDVSLTLITLHWAIRCFCSQQGFPPKHHPTHKGPFHASRMPPQLPGEIEKLGCQNCRRKGLPWDSFQERALTRGRRFVEWRTLLTPLPCLGVFQESWPVSTWGVTSGSPLPASPWAP